jgi:hypothetical protein
MQASALWHPLFQSGTRPKKCRTALAWSGTGLVPASLQSFHSFPSYTVVLNWLNKERTFQHLFLGSGSVLVTDKVLVMILLKLT